MTKHMEDLKKRVGLCLQKSRKPVLAKAPTLYVLTEKSDPQGSNYSIHIYTVCHGYPWEASHLSSLLTLGSSSVNGSVTGTHAALALVF